MAVPVLSTLHILAYLIVFVMLGRASISISISQTRKVSIRAFRKLAQGHRTRKLLCVINSTPTTCPSSAASLPRLYFFIFFQNEQLHQGVLAYKTQKSRSYNISYVYLNKSITFSKISMSSHWASHHI